MTGGEDDFTAVSADFAATDVGNSELAEKWNGLATDQPAPSEQAHPGIEPPTSWPAERKARWSSLSAEDQAFIAAREAEAHSKISSQGRELQRLRASTSDERLAHYQTEIERLQTAYQEHAAELAKRDAEQVQRDNRAVFDKFISDKPHCQDESFVWELVREMQALVAQVPGLKGELLLDVAHDRVSRKLAVPQTLAQRQQQEQQQQQEQEQQRVTQEQHERQREIAAQVEARDRQWQAVIAEREQQWAQHLSEREAQRVKELEEHTRRAKRAAIVNVKGSPGHNSKRASFESDDDTLRAIWNKAHGS